MKKELKINFADFWPSFRPTGNFLYILLSQEYNLILSDHPEVLIYSTWGSEHKKFSCFKIFYTGENHRPNFNHCDYSLSFDYDTYNGRNFRWPYFLLTGSPQQLVKNRDVNELLKTKTKFCNIVFRDPKGIERLQFLEKLNNYKKVDSGGMLMNNIGGPVDNKIEFMKPYKFTITFEHSSYPGYTTEKIFDAMIADSVPIYWGNPNINTDFNTKSFINIHDFKNFDAAIDYIMEVDSNNDRYAQYLSQPCFVKNKIPEGFKDENLLIFLNAAISARHSIKRFTYFKRNFRYKMDDLKQMSISKLRYIKKNYLTKSVPVINAAKVNDAEKYKWLEAEQSPEIITIALKFIGKKEVPEIWRWVNELELQHNYSHEDEGWSAFTHAIVIKQAGIEVGLQGYDIVTPLSWTRWGQSVEEAMLGDTLIYKDMDGEQVGMYVGEDEHAYHLLGGYTSKRYCFLRLDKEKVVSIRRPLYKELPVNIKKVNLSKEGSLFEN